MGVNFRNRAMTVAAVVVSVLLVGLLVAGFAVSSAVAQDNDMSDPAATAGGGVQGADESVSESAPVVDGEQETDSSGIAGVRNDASEQGDNDGLELGAETEREASRAGNETLATDQLKYDVHLKRIGSKDGYEIYRFALDLELPLDSEGKPIIPDTVTLQHTKRGAVPDEAVNARMSSTANGVARAWDLEDSQVSLFTYPDFDEMSAERAEKIKAVIPDTVTSDLITFDLQSQKHDPRVGPKATVYADVSFTSRISGEDEWVLYEGTETAGELNDAVNKGGNIIGTDDAPLQYWINTGYRQPKLYRMVISEDFPSKDATYHIDREIDTDTPYGDIAITPDGKKIYAISFYDHVKFGNGRPFYLDTIDADTGERIARSEVRFNYYPENQMNSLSLDHDGNLLVAGPKSRDIYKINVANCAADGAFCDIRENSSDKIQKLDLDLPRGSTMAGDFVALPNGGLYGLVQPAGGGLGGNTGQSRLFYWPPKTLNDLASGREKTPVDLGPTAGTGFGMGRIGDHIIVVDGAGWGGSNARGMSVHAVGSDFGGKNVEPVQQLMDRKNSKVTAAEGIEWPPSTGAGNRGSFWGATSIGEGGKLPGERYLNVEKELPEGRLQNEQNSDRHEFRLGAYLKENPASGLTPPVVTDGPEKGLQKNRYRGWAQVGKTYEVFEELVDQDGKPKATPSIEKYGTTLRCVLGDEYSSSARRVQISPVRYDKERNARIADVVIPDTLTESITCRFINKHQLPDDAGLEILKYGLDENGNPLPLTGANFEVYEEYPTKNSKPVSQSKEADGRLLLEGLKVDQKYYLLESKAPEGYSLLTSPLCFSLSRGDDGQVAASICSDEAGESQKSVLFLGDLASPQDDAKYRDRDTALVSVVDPLRGELPKTGGYGFVPIAVLGFLLAGFGALLGVGRKTQLR